MSIFELPEQKSDRNLPTLPDYLSCFPYKLQLYAQDPYFLAGWDTLAQQQSMQRFPPEKLWILGSVLLKADTMLRGNGLLGIRFLQAQGYRIRAVRPVEFSSDRVLDLWRHSLGRLSQERVALLQRLQQTCPSLYMVVEAPDAADPLPGSLHLTRLKGQAILADRTPDTLRSVMGEPQSAFFNFVHTADEPADFVRELGLLFDDAQRATLLDDIWSEKAQNPEESFQALSLASPKADLDFYRAISRIKDRLDAMPPRRRDQHLKRIEGLEAVGAAGWHELRVQFEQDGITVDELDEIAILGQLITMKQLRPTQPFPSCEAHHWACHRPTRPGRLQWS